MTVSVKTDNLPENLHHQYVTNRRPKKQIPIVDTEQIIKSAAKSNITRLRKGRRSSGFSRPVSPLDSNYNKTSNQNIQGAYTIPPDEKQLFMAGVTQHGVQNQQRTNTQTHAYRKE